MQLIQVKSQMSMRTTRPRNPESVTGCRELIQSLSGNSGARIVGRSRFIKGILAKIGVTGQSVNSAMGGTERGGGYDPHNTQEPTEEGRGDRGGGSTATPDPGSAGRLIATYEGA